MTTARSGLGRRVRWLWTALLLVALWGQFLSEASANAKRVEVRERETDVVGDEEVTAVGDPTRVVHTKKTVTTTRTRVAATIYTTRIAGSGVLDQQTKNALPAPANAMEHCRAGSTDAQCAADPAEAMPVAEDEDDESKHSKQRLDVLAKQDVEYKDVATRRLHELHDSLQAWLAKLHVTVADVVHQIIQAKDSIMSKSRLVSQDVVMFYDRFVADAVDALTVVYHRIAAVTSDAYGVGSSWVAVVVSEIRLVWETHEEVRVVTRHVISILLLVLIGAVFFSIYALVATVPDTVSAMWTSLDDLTRVQLKIVCMLVTAFTVYYLRAYWSFWLLLGLIIVFYYWSGHVLAKAMAPKHSTPPQRQDTRHLTASPINNRLEKPKTR